jgi:hypothetical protein
MHIDGKLTAFIRTGTTVDGQPDHSSQIVNTQCAWAFDATTATTFHIRLVGQPSAVNSA